MTGYARTAATVETTVAEGAIDVGAWSLAEPRESTAPLRVLWLMVPAASVDATLAEFVPHLAFGDTVIDGGNSFYGDDIRRAGGARPPAGIRYDDIGTSGGTWGLERGYCLMIGGPGTLSRTSILSSAPLAPGVTSALRTPGREGGPSIAEEGFLHCGPVGAEPFVKMVHNGIEYGVMAADAEGFNLRRHADAGGADREVNAETSPLANPGLYQFEIDVPAVAELRHRGSVVAYWLLDLTAQALVQSPDLSAFGGVVTDSGGGRWTSIAAIETSTPAPVLTTALYSRFTSRDEETFGNRVLPTMRWGFGGQVEFRRSRPRPAADERPARDPAGRRVRPARLGRARDPPRHRARAVPQGARGGDPRVGRRVQRRRQPRRRVRDADRRRDGDGRLPGGRPGAERVRAMGVTPFYRRFAHDGVTGPNIATVYSDRGIGVRAPVVFYNRANEAAALLRPGDFDWDAIFGRGVRWFHSGGLFAALSETTPDVLLEGMQAARRHGAMCPSTSTSGPSSGSA